MPATVKEIRETRGVNGNYRFDFDNKYLENVTIKYAKARLDSKGEGAELDRVRMNVVTDLFMGACLHCLVSNIGDRLPQHVEISELRGTAKDIENPDEEILEFDVEVSVPEEHSSELDKVIKDLNENGTGMMRFLKKTGMFTVIHKVKRI